ncbi:MAG: 50S ribosomal protein L9 [Bauldia sp.]|nr:50S ribosomal protein L9 [Bauldia sp.]
MQVILLERIAKLGQMGDVVRVRDGYARNFLLPQGKALRATKENGKRFEEQRAQLEARNLERRQEAEAVANKLNGVSFIVVRQAGETGQLYGSVTARDLVEVLETGGFNVARNQVALNQPLKSIGLHPVTIALHPEVDSEIIINVARSEDEAERQARGEDVTRPYDELEEEEAEETEELAAEGEAAAEAVEAGEETETTA